MESKGIDVSYYQGDINWNRVSENSIDFAMLRASYGSNGTDEMFVKNITGIENTNIHPGAYHYCYAMNTKEAVDEALHFIDTIKPFELHYPAALDMEERSIAQLGRKTVTDIIIAFIQTLKDHRYYPILYVSINWIRNYIDMDRISDLDIWLSDPGPKMRYTKNVTIWQYLLKGIVPGISGNVNLNMSFKDYPGIIKSEGLNGTENSNGQDEQLPPSEGEIPVVYRVRKNNTLWGIAKHFLGDGNRYKEIMQLNSLSTDTIYPGQLLMIPEK